MHQDRIEMSQRERDVLKVMSVVLRKERTQRKRPGCWVSAFGRSVASSVGWKRRETRGSSMVCEVVGQTGPWMRG